MAKVASFEQREWIDPWRDRRPMTGDMVLATVWSGEYEIIVTWYDGVDWHTGNSVLAWMPLPDKYNPVEEEVE